MAVLRMAGPCTMGPWRSFRRLWQGSRMVTRHRKGRGNAPACGFRLRNTREYRLISPIFGESGPTVRPCPSLPAHRHRRLRDARVVTGTRDGLDSYRAVVPGQGGARPRRSLRAAATTLWRQHQDLLSNAGSLVATTGVTSALGFAFWALAARLFSQRVVGYGVTATSAMTLLGTIGMLGLGTMLIGELPRRTRAAGLVSAALLASGLGSLVLGLGFAIVAPHASGQFDGIFRTPGQAALFATGVVLSGMTFVFDQATIGLLRGGLQLSRNLAFAFAKLLVLPATAIFLHNEFGAGISLSWVTGIAVSLLPVAIRLRFTGAPILPRPDWGVLRELGKTALAHNWLNLAIGVPGALIPVLVTVAV